MPSLCFNDHHLPSQLFDKIDSKHYIQHSVYAERYQNFWTKLKKIYNPYFVQTSLIEGILHSECALLAHKVSHSVLFGFSRSSLFIEFTLGIKWANESYNPMEKLYHSYHIMPKPD